MVAIALLQLTSPDLGNEYLAAQIGSPEVGDLVAMGARTKRFQVVAVYPYYPIALGVKERVSLAIVHPVGKPVPKQEDWYCWENREYCPEQALHLLRHGDRVLRTEEKSAGQLPAVGKPVVNYRSIGTMQKVKLDRASVAIALGKAKALPSDLAIDSYEKHISPDAPYHSIYVVQAASVPAVEPKLLQLA